MDQGNSKVSAAPGRQGAGMGVVPAPIVKTGTAIRGFGAGGMDASLAGNETVGSGSTNGKGSIKGFSGSGVKGSKV